MKIIRTFSPAVKEKLTSALVGLALGDALGGPVENLTKEQISQIYPAGVKDFVMGPAPGWNLGQVTDDTEMAFVVMASLAEKHEFDMDDLAQRFACWGKTVPKLGPSSGHAAKVLLNGGHWSTSGNSKSPSSGCLPRCAPMALVMAKKDVIKATLDCCRMTHSHMLAVAAVVAQNILIERLVNGSSWQEAVAELKKERFKIEGAREILLALEGKFALPGAVDVLAESFRFVDQARTAEQALIASVAFGGDTDTRGAVTGVLAGVRWGIKAWPERWVTSCRDTQEAKRLCGLLW